MKHIRPTVCNVVIGLTAEQLTRLEEWQKLSRSAGKDITKQQLIMKMLEQGHDVMNVEMRKLEVPRSLTLIKK